MEFRLDEGQVGLQETVDRFCADRFPLDAIVSREGQGLDRQAWSDLAELGVFSLMLPESVGGSALGAVEAAIVFEQFGSHLVSGPLLWSVLAAPLVTGVASGEVVVGGVEAAALLGGTAAVEHASELDAVLVLHDDRIVVHRTSELSEPAPLEPFDPLTPIGRLSGFDDAGGEVVGDAAMAAALRNLGTVLVAAAAAGVAARSLEVARAYALERHQFDVPIGSFQAIKHILADMFVRSSLAQSASYAAAAVLDDPGSHDPGQDDPGLAGSAAKVVAADAARRNAATAIQVLGGMGFTWDMLPNHLLKRAWVLEHTFGEADHHAEMLGAALAGARR